MAKRESDSPMTLLQIDLERGEWKSRKPKFPPFHEIWNFEGDERVISKRWFYVLRLAFGDTFLKCKCIDHNSLTQMYASKEQFRKDGFFLITARSETVATAFAWTDRIDEKEVGIVHWVAVAPESQRSGIGRAVVELVLRNLCDRGFKRALVRTESYRTDAISMYCSIGFRRVSESGVSRCDSRERLVPERGEIAAEPSSPSLGDSRALGNRK